MANGTQTALQSTLPATIVQNQGRPKVTLMSSKDQRMMPAGDHPANPIAARSPYWRAAGVLLTIVSVNSERNGCVSDEPWSRGPTGIVPASMVAPTAVLDPSKDSEVSAGEVDVSSDEAAASLSGGVFGVDFELHSDKFRAPKGI